MSRANFAFFIVPLFLALSAFSVPAFSQKLPDKIRGYKVYQAKIAVKTAGGEVAKVSSEPSRPKSAAEAFVKIGEPELVDVSLAGITFEISGEIDSPEQSGKIDFLMFRDFRINGLAVEIEEYTESFEFKKNEPARLPKPARIFLGSTETLRAAWRESKDSSDEWQITGRVFVFGKFKKFGLSFKRVVPVDVNLKIKNPLRANFLSN